MIASREVREFIRGWEGLRLYPYRDSAGHWTVGWGHLMSPDDEIRMYTEAECEEFFELDIMETEAGVDAAMTVDIPQPCFDALVSFAFNLGVSRLKNSTLLRKINEARLEDAVHEFERWVYATDPATGKLRVVEGLVKRRAAERDIFEYGDYSGHP